MDEDQKQFISQDKHNDLQKELTDLRENKLPNLAKKIDEARQHGDLSENAEYQTAREEMMWAQSRVIEIEAILNNSSIISSSGTSLVVRVGSEVKVKINGIIKTYKIVGAHEASPAEGKISNESPLGQSFLGKKKNEKVQVNVPAGVQIYEILEVN